MNIHKALKRLELIGGHIFRDEDDPVAIGWDKNKEWGEFLQLRISLTVTDLMADDWKHSRKQYNG